jgi:hypothetical protein
LLGDARDPFNRKPLTIDMVQPGKFIGIIFWGG